MAHIGIVGAGISGLAAAISLQAAGHTVELFERAPELKEVGSGLTLWANATRVLGALGVLASCQARGQQIARFNLKLASGRQLMTIPIENFSTAAFVMHRSDLQKALLDALPPGTLHTEHEVLGVREDAGGVYVRLARGERGPFGLVVGADGVRSLIRRYVFGEDRPSYRGYYVWRGVAASALPGYAVGEISETWGRGERFGILPMGEGRVCWYAAVNRPLAAMTLPADRAALLVRRFGAWHQPISALIAATPKDGIIESPAFDRVPRRGWSRGRVLLIGDAAHPLTPNLGQGACMALEDAQVLSRLFGPAAKGRPIAEVLAAFEAARFGRIHAMAGRCRRLGAIGQWQNPVVTAVRNAVTGLVPGSLFAYTSRTIQDYRADLD